MTEGTLQFAELPIDQVIANPRNPRKHPGEQMRRLRASLRDNGQPRPVLVRKANLMLIAGHAIWQAARSVGFTKIAAMTWDISQHQADRYMLGDNVLGSLSTPDQARVVELLAELDEAEYLGTGFSEDEARGLLAEATSVAVAEIETTEVHDDFWISVRGPLPDQADVLQRLRALLAEYDRVSVELGTIPIP
jgi:ParB-like chromosome segregation protein Spo0J